MGRDVLAEDVGGQLPALLELGLQGLLGVLLDVEIDGQLNVSTGNRIDVLIDQFVHDAARGIDFEDLLAPRAVQRVFHRKLDTECAHQFVGVVVLVLVLLLGLFGDRPEVPDDVTGEWRVRIDPLPLLDDLNARKVLAALLQVRHCVFVDILLQRQRQQGAVALTLRALRDRRLIETRFVAALQIDDGDLQGSGESLEQRLAILRLPDHTPIDGDGEDALVVGHDPALGVEDPAPFGWDQHLA